MTYGITPSPTAAVSVETIEVRTSDGQTLFVMTSGSSDRFEIADPHVDRRIADFRVGEPAAHTGAVRAQVGHRVGVRRDDDLHRPGLDRPGVRRGVPVVEVFHTQRDRDSLR